MTDLTAVASAVLALVGALAGPALAARHEQRSLLALCEIAADEHLDRRVRALAMSALAKALLPDRSPVQWIVQAFLWGSAVFGGFWLVMGAAAPNSLPVAKVWAMLYGLAYLVLFGLVFYALVLMPANEVNARAQQIHDDFLRATVDDPEEPLAGCVDARSAPTAGSVVTNEHGLGSSSD